MKLTLKDREQKSITIDGSRYRYAGLLKRFEEINKAGNLFIDDAHEMLRGCRCVYIRSISGQYTTITQD